jgi:hypothetical protein
MDSMVRMAALRLARKVAFGASFSVGALAGCGDRMALPPERSGALHDAAELAVIEPPSPVAEPPPPMDATVLPDTAIAPALACGGPVELAARAPYPPSGVTRPQFDCCLDYTRTAAKEPMAFASDPSAVNCCKVLIAAVDDDRRLAFYDPPRSQCCFTGAVAPAQELYAHWLCAPWGPPVPAAMPGPVA